MSAVKPIKYNQQIEAVLNNQPEFVPIDSWFPLSFMKSTDKHKKK